MLGGSWKEIYLFNNPAFKGLYRPLEGLQAYGAGQALVLGGFADDQTSPRTSNLSSYIALPGLVEFDLETKEFTNSSAAGYSGNGTAERGRMEYVPAFGPKGVFVVMGGDDFGSVLNSFENVSVYDPSSAKWFNQTTTGNTPEPRIEFCTAGVNSTNNTYEM